MLTYDELCCIARHCDIPTFSALEEATYCKFKPSQRHDTIRLLEKHLQEVMEHRRKYFGWYGLKNFKYCFLNPWKEHCKWSLRQIRRHREGIPDIVYDKTYTTYSGWGCNYEPPVQPKDEYFLRRIVYIYY